MFNPEQLLGQLLGGTLGGARGGRRRSGFNIGGLGKAQLGIGLLGVAMAAWEHYKQQPGTGSTAAVGPAQAAPSASPPPPPPPPPLASSATRQMPRLEPRQQSAVLLIRTMIAAANADGHIDAEERAAIVSRAQQGGLDAESIAFLEAEIARPQSLQQVIANVTPELVAETYAAAAYAITVDNDAERDWLNALAISIGLDPATRADIDARIAAG